jgi:hypothetical protein
VLVSTLFASLVIAIVLVCVVASPVDDDDTSNATDTTVTSGTRVTNDASRANQACGVNGTRDGSCSACCGAIVYKWNQFGDWW